MFEIDDKGETTMFEIDDMELDHVTGGAVGPTDPSPTATGAVTYKCPNCGAVIYASTRDMSVTCPNRKCMSTFNVRKGRLIACSL